MATPRTPPLPVQDASSRSSVSPPRRLPSLLRPQHSNIRNFRTHSSLPSLYRATHANLLKQFEAERSPTSVTKFRRERLRQKEEMETFDRFRQRPTIDYQESEASDTVPPGTPSEFDPYDQPPDTDTDPFSHRKTKPRISETSKSTTTGFAALYGEDFEGQDWSLSSRPSFFDEHEDQVPATPTPPARKVFRGTEDEIALVQDHTPMGTERTTLNGKTLRPRSALSAHAAKLGFSPQVSHDTVKHYLGTRRKPKPKINASSMSSRNAIRQQISTITKAKRDRFVYNNRSLLLPLLPTKNYIDQLSGQTFSSVRQYEDVVQPEGINAIMKPYQLKGLSFLVHMHNNGMPAILGDEMGLGKTLQTLSLFQYLKEKKHRTIILPSKEIRPFLVVCPLTVLENWVAEARKFTPTLKVLRFHGPVSEREILKDELRKRKTRSSHVRDTVSYTGAAQDMTQSTQYELVITTYEAFKAESAWFKTVAAWRYVVLDEGHRIKNYKSQESRCLQSLQAEYRIILTGTPLQNDLVEMWSLFHWLLPDIFPENTLPLFKRAFNLTKGQVDRSVLENSRRLLELIMLRRMKSSVGVNLNLPPKQVIRLFVPLTPMQKKWYLKLLTQQSDDMLEDIYRGAQGKEQNALHGKGTRSDSAHESGMLGHSNTSILSTNVDRSQVEHVPIQNRMSTPTPVNKDSWRRLLNLVLQLRKVCTHPYLMPDAAPEVNLIGPHVYINSGKFMALYKLIDELVLHQRKKMIIFSNFTEVLDWVHDLISLVSECGAHFQCIRLDGTTLRAKRNLYVRLFQQTDSPYLIFLISTKAGGVGLNLTAATEAVFMDEDWNPQVDLQAEARCHRIGQTKPVTIYKLCTSGSVEEQMLGRIHKKLYLSAKITEAMENIHDTPTKSDGDQLTLAESKSLFGNYSEFKSLLRRGTQTLTGTGTDSNDLLNWDFNTMIEKCQQKLDPGGGADEVDEEKWLSTMERVECAVFEGQNYVRQRQSFVDPDMTPTTSRHNRHIGKELTVEVDGFAVNKESLECAQWESVPTLAGKDAALKDIKWEKATFAHQEHCQACYQDGGLIIMCTNCPRVYHAECMDEEARQRANEFGNWSCFQHSCHECGKKAAEAGGMIFRCRWCPYGYCEDCLDWDAVKLIGDTIDEYKILGFPIKREAYYIACPSCNDPELHDTFEVQAESYHELAQRAEAGEHIDLAAPIVSEDGENFARHDSGQNIIVGSTDERLMAPSSSFSALSPNDSPYIMADRTASEPQKSKLSTNPNHTHLHTISLSASPRPYLESSARSTDFVSTPTASVSKYTSSPATPMHKSASKRKGHKDAERSIENMGKRQKSQAWEIEV